MCPGNLPKFAEAGAAVGGRAVSDDLYKLKKFQGHDCCHIFSDSPCIKGIVQNLLKVTSSSSAMLVGI